MLTNTGRLRGKIRGGASGTSEYPSLKDKPQINGVTLEGNQTPEDLQMKLSQLTNDAGYAKSSIVAPEYSEEATYDVGDYVTYENTLYKCNSKITTAEEWNPEHWTAVNVAEIIPTKTSDLENDSGFVTSSAIPTKTSDLNNDSGYVNSSIVANPYDSTSTYAVGAYVTHENNLYKCNTAIETAEEWNAEHWTLVDVISAIPTKTSDLDNDSNYASIDDTSTANNKAWSASKIESEINDKVFDILPTSSTSGAVANFTTNYASSIDTAFGIKFTQESGTPTPSTPKTITGFSSIEVSHSGADTSNPDVITIALGGTYYKGRLTQDKHGHRQLVITHKVENLGDYTFTHHNSGFWYRQFTDMKPYAVSETADLVAEKYVKATGQWIYGHGSSFGYCGTNGNMLYITDSTDPSGKIVYQLLNEITIDLEDGTPIIAKVGENNLWCNSGDTSATYKLGLDSELDEKADKSDTYTKAEIDKTIYRITEHGLYQQATRATLLNTDTLNVGTTNNNKKNEVIEFIGYFSSFSSVSVGHGYNTTNGNYVTVDDTNLTVYKDNATVVTQVAHGLTISDFIHIIISQNDKVRAEVQIMTSTGNYTLASCVWTGCAGYVFAKVGTTMSNVVCSGVYKDFKEKIFLFGDSYVSLDDAQRYPKYLIDNGYGQLLIDGYGGRTSVNALTSFNNIIAKAIPDYVVWALGMNDPDTTEINSSWLSCVQSVIDTCEEKDIELILATIPNTPTHENSYKNAWVKSSGFRYVDFAKSVGAESSGSTWYTGMLYTDNVHPTTLGAKALYTRFLTDVPEIIR